MENRSAFGSQTQPEWFIAVGEKSVGPISAPEVYDRVMSGEITWISYVWKEGMSGWQRLCDVPTFQAAVPPPPAAKPQVQPPAPPSMKMQPKEWFLFFNEAQHGPFGLDEVEGMAGAGKINSEILGWKDGMSGWEKVGTLSAFAGFFGANPPPVATAEESGREKRAYSRRPILAKIMIAEKDQLIVGMARDISIGGMQVLSEFVPSNVGSRLKLNVSAPEPTNPAFPPFVAEGVVVRLHQDRRGFSFRFDELSATARQIIEKIIQG